MNSSLTKRKALLTAAAATLALAACDNTSDGPTIDFTQQKLSTVVNSVITTQTADTAIPLEINALNLDTQSDDLALPNSDPNYSGLVGT